MKHFIDFKILPDPEFCTPILMNALYSKLHRGLVEINNRELGVSFPGYTKKPRKLGGLLRLHGSAAGLQTLMNLNWLKGMSDHVVVSEIAEVPKTVKYLKVSRVQVKSGAARIRRRQMKRQGMTEEEALIKIPDSMEKRIGLPFLSLSSKSTNQRFRLFIQHEVVSDHATGEFNCYGLSAVATIPSF